MEQRLSLITLGVQDVPRARQFYEALGWRSAGIEGEDVVFFQLNGMALSLFPRTSLAEDATVSAEGSGFPGFSLAYNVREKQDVHTVLDHAVACGRL